MNFYIKLFFISFLSFFSCWAHSADRPIYVYSDFGGGKNAPKQAVFDEQTAQELSSAAWKKTKKRELFINDSAQPLSPAYAALALARAFPYQEKGERAKKIGFIEKLVVHVIDPGVENDGGQEDHHPRSAVLRKDGVLFIGPDNGTLSLVCPKDSIASIWQIDTEELQEISGNDTSVGGTFHGRDVFLDFALLIASEKISLGEFSKAYEKPDLKYRLSALQLAKENTEIETPEFFKLATNRWKANWKFGPLEEDFGKAFFLGIIQSPYYREGESDSLPFKVFWAQNSEDCELVAIVNYLTCNIYVGPNNGWGTSFFSGYPNEAIKTYRVEKEVLSYFWNKNKHEKLIKYIQNAPYWTGDLETISFLDSEADLVYDKAGRPIAARARIWIDAYGNIKTSLRADVFGTLPLGPNSSIRVEINGVTRPLVLESSFARVPKGTVFLYPSSSGCIGNNPRRSHRYLEISTNGIYGEFGSNLFNRANIAPRNGQIATFYFNL